MDETGFDYYISGVDSLELRNLSGHEKGNKIKEIRETLIREFGSYSPVPTQILKGKNIKRVFWAVADLDNLDEIQEVLALDR